MRDFNRNRGGFGGGGQGRGGFGRDSGRAQMYEATCSDCGKGCEVPFKPFAGKPVYCNDCFRKEDGFDSDRSDRGGKRDFGKPNFRDRGDSRDRGDRPMHEATCAECGEKCEVPFRPNGEKPVYCRDCFGSSKGKDSGPSFKKPEQSSGQMDQLNAKLDKILKTMEIMMGKKEFIVERKQAAEDVPKVTKPKKPKRKTK